MLLWACGKKRIAVGRLWGRAERAAHLMVARRRERRSGRGEGQGGREGEREEERERKREREGEGRRENVTLVT